MGLVALLLQGCSNAPSPAKTTSSPWLATTPAEFQTTLEKTGTSVNPDDVFARGFCLDLGLTGTLDSAAANIFLLHAANTGSEWAAAYLRWRETVSYPNPTLAGPLTESIRNAPVSGALPARLARWFVLDGRLLKPSAGAMTAYFSAAAETSDTNAMEVYAAHLEDGRVLGRKDALLRMQLLARAATAGSARAQTLAAATILAGTPSPDERTLALEWLRLASRAGSANAMTLLGNTLIDEPSTDSRLAGLNYLEIASLTRADLLERLYTLLSDGIGDLPPDKPRALRVAERALELNQPFALLAVAVEIQGKSPQADARAYKLLSSAADLGSARAIACLAKLVESGRGTTADPAAARQLFERAADLGDSQATAELAMIYREGRHTLPDPIREFKWTEKAARRGDAYHMSRLGTMLRDGIGAEKDPEEAVVWFNAAAKERDPMGHLNLAFHYLQGLGVERNFQLAAEEAIVGLLIDDNVSLRKTLVQAVLALEGKMPAKADEIRSRLIRDGDLHSNRALIGAAIELAAAPRNEQESKAISAILEKAENFESPELKLIIAWQHWLGKIVKQDTQKALALLRAAPESKERTDKLNLIISVTGAPEREKRSAQEALIRWARDLATNPYVPIQRLLAWSDLESDHELALSLHNQCMRRWNRPEEPSIEALAKTLGIELITESELAEASAAVDRAIEAAIDGQPSPVLKKNPAYPLELKLAQIEGSAEVMFIVDPSGEVEDAWSVNATHPLFAEAATASIRRWKFKPGIKNGKPVRCRVMIPIKFELRRDDPIVPQLPLPPS